RNVHFDDDPGERGPDLDPGPVALLVLVALTAALPDLRGLVAHRLDFLLGHPPDAQRPFRARHRVEAALDGPPLLAELARGDGPRLGQFLVAVERVLVRPELGEGVD